MANALLRGIQLGMLLTLSVVCSILVLEGACRILFPQYNPEGSISFKYDSAGVPVIAERNKTLRQWKNTGDYDVLVTADSYGFRNSHEIGKLNEDVIFAVGDSFSFGWGVREEERYSDQLERLLERTVANISASTHIEGYGKLVAYANTFTGPVKRVVIGVCMENDLIRYIDLAAIRSEPRRINWRREFNINVVKAYLSSHSTAYRVATSLAHNSPPLRRLAIALGLIVPNFDGIGNPVYSRELIDQSVTMLKEIVRRHDLDPIILIIPSRALWIGSDRENADLIHREFVDQLRAARILVVDLRPEFEAGGSPLAFHFETDGHWNPRGHKIAAKKLAHAIREERSNWFESEK